MYIHNCVHIYYIIYLLCAGTSCEVLSNPSDGTVSVPSRTVGSTATYSCNTGFNLVGGKTRVCRAGGVWSGKTPDCQGSV